MTDPFAPVIEEAPAPQVEEKKETVVAQSEGKIVVTFKGGTGYDAPWIVIHADNVQDALGQFSGDNAGSFKELIDEAAKVGKYFSSTGGGSKPTATPVAGQAGKPAAATEAPGGEQKSCAHGEMTFRSGVSKTSGKPYRAFFCPERDKSQQCKPQFLN